MSSLCCSVDCCESCRDAWIQVTFELWSIIPISFVQMEDLGMTEG